MGEVRACVYFSVIFLCFQIGIAKPMFGTRFWCDWLCDDDDISTTTTASAEDDDYGWCSDCPVRRPRPRTTTTRAPPNFGPMQQPFNFIIPPGGNGMNLSWSPNQNPNQPGWLGIYFSPNTATPAPGVRPPAPPPVPPVPAIPTPSAPPAASSGATPAPGAATTPAATTAAATTAAAGK